MNPHIHHLAYHTSSSAATAGMLRRGTVGGVLLLGCGFNFECSTLRTWSRGRSSSWSSRVRDSFWLSRFLDSSRWSRLRLSSLDLEVFLVFGVLTFLLNLESTRVSTDGSASQNKRLSSVSCVRWRVPSPPPSGPYEADG